MHNLTKYDTHYSIVSSKQKKSQKSLFLHNTWRNRILFGHNSNSVRWHLALSTQIAQAKKRDYYIQPPRLENPFVSLMLKYASTCFIFCIIYHPKWDFSSTAITRRTTEFLKKKNKFARISLGNKVSNPTDDVGKNPVQWISSTVIFYKAVCVKKVSR